MPRKKIMTASNGSHPHVDVQVINVTPAIAGDWISRNPKNRKLRDARVRRYANAMMFGQWKFTGDTIKLTRTGEIVDGQHRLTAIIVADVTIPMLVARGIDAESFDAIDVGIPRTATDALHMNGHSSAHALAGALGILYRYRHSGIFARGREIDLPTTLQLETLLEEEPELERFVTDGYKVQRQLNAGLGQIATLMYLTAQVDEDDAKAFWDHVRTGEELKKNSPILRLRERLRAKGRLGYNEIGAITIKAWNTYRRGQEMSALGWKSNEPMPTPE